MVEYQGKTLEGSAQLFKKGFEDGYNTNYKVLIGDDDRFKTSVIDFLTVNTDRHGKNFMINPKTKEFILIDNGYLYPDKARYASQFGGGAEFLTGELRTGTIVHKDSMAGIDALISNDLRENTLKQLKSLDIDHLGAKWNLSRSAMDAMVNRRDFMVWAIEKKKWAKVWRNYNEGGWTMGLDIPESLLQGWKGN